MKQTRCHEKRKKRSTSTNDCSIEPKKRKANAIKCANGCGRCIAGDDPAEMNAIQCCHQVEFYPWIEDNCSRWLCNTCRIKLGLPITTTTWFCADCIDMHFEEEWLAFSYFAYVKCIIVTNDSENSSLIWNELGICLCIFPFLYKFIWIFRIVFLNETILSLNRCGLSSTSATSSLFRFPWNKCQLWYLVILWCSE